MNVKKTVAVFGTLLLACTLTTGFGLKDAIKDVKSTAEKSSGDKCDKAKDKKRCERKEKLKTAATVVAVSVAVKVIYDMVIDYKSKNVTAEDEVVKAYKAKHKTLPDKPQVVAYSTSLKPGQVVKPGKPILLVSKLEVVPGKDGGPILVQEKIAIHDNEDPKKVIKSLVKSVNESNKKGGIYENEFSFTLPVGMPQGVYPLETAILLNDQELNKENNEMQVVLEVMQDGRYQLAMAN